MKLEDVVAGRTEPVSDPRLSHDVCRFVGEFDLFAQLADGDPQIFGLVGIRAPHCMEQRSVREDLPRVLSETDEQIELLRR